MEQTTALFKLINAFFFHHVKRPELCEAKDHYENNSKNQPKVNNDMFLEKNNFLKKKTKMVIQKFYLGLMMH